MLFAFIFVLDSRVKLIGDMFWLLIV